jgi:(R,R)-butanediol dehydrogenase/meso-butanediol dehydrogenase/diacetyl reductase
VPTEMGALVEPMAVAYHAAALGGVNEGSTAPDLWCGRIGTGIWFALRRQGLTEIDVVAPCGTSRCNSSTWRQDH